MTEWTSHSDAQMVQRFNGESPITLCPLEIIQLHCAFKHLIFYHLRILLVIECGLARTRTLQLMSEVVRCRDGGGRGYTLYYFKTRSGQRKQILASICGGNRIASSFGTHRSVHDEGLFSFKHIQLIIQI